MYLFLQFDAQIAFFDRLSRTMSHVQQLVQLNMQLRQTLFEELAKVCQRMLTAELTRAAAEETDKSMREQEETLTNFPDPFRQGGTRCGRSAAQSQGRLQSGGDEANVDPGVTIADQGGKVSAQGHMQGNRPRQSGNRIPCQTR